MTNTKINAPAGMWGLACEPWSKGEWYAVAADWSQASCNVLVWGDEDWTYDKCGRQVADFRHRQESALAAILETAIEMSGDKPDSDEIDDLVASAIKI